MSALAPLLGDKQTSAKDAENVANDPELTRGPELISIGPKVFDLLAYLVQNCDRVVSKDDLLEAVWGGRVVSESTLTSHINFARKAVGDSGDEQNLIRTVARKGFRFVGEVKERQASRDRASSTRVSEANDERTTIPKPALVVRDRAQFKLYLQRGQAVDVKQVGRELGVRYVLEGSMRRAGNRVRICGQLIDSSTGANLWAREASVQALESVY